MQYNYDNYSAINYIVHIQFILWSCMLHTVHGSGGGGGNRFTNSLSSAANWYLMVAVATALLSTLSLDIVSACSGDVSAEVLLPLCNSTDKWLHCDSRHTNGDPAVSPPAAERISFFDGPRSLWTEKDWCPPLGNERQTVKDCLLVLLNCTIWRDPSVWSAAVAGCLHCTSPASMHCSVRVTVVMGIEVLSSAVLLFCNEYRLENKKSINSTLDNYIVYNAWKLSLDQSVYSALTLCQFHQLSFELKVKRFIILAVSLSRSVYTTDWGFTIVHTTSTVELRLDSTALAVHAAASCKRLTLW